MHMLLMPRSLKENCFRHTPFDTGLAGKRGSNAWPGAWIAMHSPVVLVTGSGITQMKYCDGSWLYCGPTFFTFPSIRACDDIPENSDSFRVLKSKRPSL